MRTFARIIILLCSNFFASVSIAQSIDIIENHTIQLLMGAGGESDTEKFTSIQKEIQNFRRQNNPARLAVEVATPSPLSSYLSSGKDQHSWALLEKARNYAIYSDSKSGRNVEYFTRNYIYSYWKKIGAELKHETPSSLIPVEVYPVGVNGEPIVLWKSKKLGMDVFSVGADPVRPLPPELVPNTDDLGIALKGGVSIKTRGRLSDYQVVHGNDPGIFSAHLLPTIGPRSDTEDTSAIATFEIKDSCIVQDRVDKCYLPAVALHDDTTTYCSGTLIGSRWVLSASHCFCGSEPVAVTIGNAVPDERKLAQPPFVTAYFSGQLVHFDDGFCERFIELKGADDSFEKLDIALAELKYPVISNGIQPTALIASEEILNSLRYAEVASFGATRVDAFGGKKLVVSVNIKLPSCTGFADDSRKGNPYGCIPGKELVAIDPGFLKDTCHADSGGGVYARLENNNLALVALVSRGVRGECGLGGIYPLVTTAEVQKWIKQHVSDVQFVDDSQRLAADLPRKTSPRNSTN